MVTVDIGKVIADTIGVVIVESKLMHEFDLFGGRIGLHRMPGGIGGAGAVTIGHCHGG